MLAFLENKRFLLIVGILAIVVGFTLTPKPEQKTPLTSQTEIQDTNTPSPTRTQKFVDSVPTVQGNTIKINVVNPHYSPNNEGISEVYEYTFTYERRSDDIISPSRQGFNKGLEIKRGTAILLIGVAFDGGQMLFNKIPNPVPIDNPMSDNQIHRVTSKDLAYSYQTPFQDYDYVSYYQENKPAMIGTNSCGQSIDPIAACSMGSVSVKDSIIVLSCNADSDSVYNCDDIVKSLSVHSIGLE